MIYPPKEVWSPINLVLQTHNTNMTIITYSMITLDHNQYIIYQPLNLVINCEIIHHSILKYRQDRR